VPNVPAAADRRPIELLLADDDLAHTHDDLAHTNDHVWRRREWRHDDEYGRAYFHGGGGIVIGADHRNDDPGLHVRLAVTSDARSELTARARGYRLILVQALAHSGNHYPR